MWNLLWTVSLLFNFPSAPLASSFLVSDAHADSLIVDSDQAPFDLQVAGDTISGKVKMGMFGSSKLTGERV